MKTKKDAGKHNTRLSSTKLTQEIKQKAFALGAHLVGIAPIGRMKNAPKDLHPKRLLPGVKSLISMAYRINRGVQQVHLRGVSPMAFSRFASLEPKFRLDDMALDLANFLEDFDFVSLPIPANQYYNLEQGLGEISHRHVAMAAGIGRLGRGGFLVTPQYGGAVQLITVLTTARLKPDPIIEKSPCNGCAQPCVSICPVKALSSHRERTMKMDGREYRYGWISYLRCLWGCGGMVMGDRFYALSDLPMPVIPEEDDIKKVQLEYLLAGEKRFPWDRATRGSFAYSACSKCYVVCHPEKLKKRAGKGK